MPWIVHVIGNVPTSETHFSYVDPDIGSSDIEISVVHDDNGHGRRSLGWGGPQKFVVAHFNPLPPVWLFNDVRASAQKLADHLNEKGIDKLPERYVTQTPATAR